MKAKVIATGEIVNVILVDTNGCTIGQYREIFGDRHFHLNELQFLKEDSIDWEKRRFELVKSALQGLLSNVKYQELSDGYNDLAKIKGKTFDETVFYAELACDFADAIIAKLKER